jgi:hypothetical protein
MDEHDIVVVTGEQVRGLLAGREPQVVDAVLGSCSRHLRHHTLLPACRALSDARQAGA